jgi:hypothetical protein
MWDSRTQASVMTVNHGYPVEDIVVFPSGGLCASAGNIGCSLGTYLVSLLCHCLDTPLANDTNMEGFLSAIL